MSERKFEKSQAFCKKEEKLRQSTLLETRKKLQHDVQKLFKDPQYCDLVLMSQSNELLVHSFILEARSPDFYRYIKGQPQSGKIEIVGMSYNELERLIETMYSEDGVNRVLIERVLSLTKDEHAKQLTDQKSTLSSDLSLLFNSNTTGDVEFVVDGKIVRAHKAILATRCEYFGAMFSSFWKEGSSSSIAISDISYEIFLAILKFLYGACQEILSFPASKVLQFADMYGMQDLMDLILMDLKIKECHLFHKPCSYCIPQVYECYKLCEAFYQTKNLQMQCIQWVSKNFEKTLPCKQFPQMSENFQSAVRQEIHKQMMSSTVMVLWHKFNTLIASLKNLNTSWTKTVLKFLEELQEVCVKETVENFACVCNLFNMSEFLKITNHSSGHMERFLNEVIGRLTVSNCCYVVQSLQKLIDTVMAMGEEESHFCNPFGSGTFQVVQECFKQCEKFIIGRIGPVSQTNAWQDFSLSRQQELKSRAFFVDL